jgi:hypothetical protein
MELSSDDSFEMVHISLLDNSKTHFEEMAHYMP